METQNNNTLPNPNGMPLAFFEANGHLNLMKLLIELHTELLAKPKFGNENGFNTFLHYQSHQIVQYICMRRLSILNRFQM